MRGKRKSAKLFSESERVQESRDRESAKGSNQQRVRNIALGSWRQRERFQVGVLNYEGHLEFNFHSGPGVLSCVSTSSCVAIPHCVGMSL